MCGCMNDLPQRLRAFWGKTVQWDLSKIALFFNILAHCVCITPAMLRNWEFVRQIDKKNAKKPPLHRHLLHFVLPEFSKLLPHFQLSLLKIFFWRLELLLACHHHHVHHLLLDFHTDCHLRRFFGNDLVFKTIKFFCRF